MCFACLKENKHGGRPAADLHGRGTSSFVVVHQVLSSPSLRFFPQVVVAGGGGSGRVVLVCGGRRRWWCCRWRRRRRGVVVAGSSGSGCGWWWWWRRRLRRWARCMGFAFFFMRMTLPRTRWASRHISAERVPACSRQRLLRRHNCAEKPSPRACS